MFSYLSKAKLFASLVIAVVFSAAMSVSAGAETLLRIERGGELVKAFDRADLEAMPQISFSTSTIWTEGQTEFTGVSLRALLAEAGITSGNFRAIALNDYAVEMPFDELLDDAPIIAHRLNGEPFSRRGKGPLWIVYPYDSSPSFQTEIAYGRSVWQLDRLTVN